MSLESDIRRRPEVRKIAGIQVVNFSSLPAHQQTLGTYPGKILVRGEIKDSKLTVKLKVGDDLNGFDLLFYRWGTGTAGTGDQRRFELECLYRGVLISRIEEIANQCNAVVAVGGRDLHLADFSKFP